MWCAWTLATTFGLLITEAIVVPDAALWSALASLGFDPGRGPHELELNALLALAISGSQYLALRMVPDVRAMAVKAWVPVSVLVFVVEDFVGIYWFGDQVPVAVGLVFWAVLSLAQGLVLAEVFGLRSAVAVWLVAMAGVFGAGYLVTAIPLDVSGLNQVAQAVVAGLVLGALYGGVSGAFLAGLVWVARRTVRAAPASEAEGELLVRL